jgi:hypothetical protein
MSKSSNSLLVVTMASVVALVVLNGFAKAVPALFGAALTLGIMDRCIRDVYQENEEEPKPCIDPVETTPTRQFTFTESDGTVHKC